MKSYTVLLNETQLIIKRKRVICMLDLDELSVREVFTPRIEFDPSKDFFAQQGIEDEDTYDWVSFKLLLP